VRDITPSRCRSPSKGKILLCCEGSFFFFRKGSVFEQEDSFFEQKDCLAREAMNTLAFFLRMWQLQGGEYA